MSQNTEAITVHISLSAYGDALIYGSTKSNSYVPGLYLKQRLFAWHEASFYGTELEIQQVQEVEVIVLPPEYVLPFLADRKLLSHIEWIWDEEASQLIQLVSALNTCIEEKKFIPSLSAFQKGKLQWTWDKKALDAKTKFALENMDSSLPSDYDGLGAAFSSTVSHRYYGTEIAASDLRSEYPMLFTKNSAVQGLNEQAWLVSIGWRADTAPFRPLLQLLEPDDEEPIWRLKLVLQDKFDPSVLMSVRLAEDGHVSGQWPDSWSSHIKERSAGWLEHLRASFPREQWGGHMQDVLSKPLSDEAAWQFLTVDSRRLLEAGWQVLLPAWWEAASRKKPKLRAKVRADEGSNDQQGSKGNSFFGLNSIIQFDWRIAIGETQLTEAEFAELVARNERLVQFRGQWIPLDPALLAQIRQAMDGVDSSQGLSFQDILHLHLLESSNPSYSGRSTDQPEEEEEETSQRIQLGVELNEYLIKLMSQLGRQTEWPKLPVPSKLQTDLRTYQYDGYSWLAFLRRFGLGACLADDMGLGKTVQFIAYLLHLQENRTDGDTRVPSLLICPTSVLGNWQKELNRFAPSLRVMLHYGSGRSNEEVFQEEIKQADVIITSYATATLDQELLKEFTWDSLCLDEAQNIKNAQTKQSTAVRSFPAKHRIVLTGTPIENRLSELWSLYDFMNPGYLGSARAFNTRFIQAIEKDHDEQRTINLQKLVKPFMLRRKKKDPAIQLDLPDKNEMKTYIQLTGEQSALYDQTVNNLMSKMKELKGIERKGAILATLTHLKQLCDHPVLLTKDFLPDSQGKQEDSSLVTEMLINRSSKLERLLEMVKELRDEGERCLIFTQYIGMGEILKHVLMQELGEPVLYLNGSTSKTARDRMIDQFQSQTLPPDEQPSVFILSIKAGGVGLNLTAANHVFHFDRWWNPAVENQATDRAYRMGQTKDVQVHKFISLGTLEERIDEMLENKQQLSDNVISSTENWITELSTEALKDLFTLRHDFV
ncbi:DEAD/DEAH box helicase [Paenibacillus motobuensis]|uniref:DEAD/DEAH box helicase n=1 Tax=Paenibacillus TaxID=44249 RepID=UPI00203C8C29|nr:MULTISPECIES: DEAD/DEAH box helicase [Paenibacillus]MCM3042905.1 DEAD/DEAH box helicase [Paenibacillus lutimineralis]MCM3650009.1 DEAD/DEAH box helicase [Paenibacillus motobuensis]